MFPPGGLEQLIASLFPACSSAIGERPLELANGFIDSLTRIAVSRSCDGPGGELVPDLLEARPRVPQDGVGRRLRQVDLARSGPDRRRRRGAEDGPDVLQRFLTMPAVVLIRALKSSMHGLQPSDTFRANTGSAARMYAFTRLLVTQYPRPSAAHLALRASFTQMATNSWHPFDRAAVERTWKLALDEARQALVLDPQDVRAGAQVADLQKRLDLLLASQPEFRDSNRTPQTAGEAGR